MNLNNEVAEVVKLVGPGTSFFSADTVDRCLRARRDAQFCALERTKVQQREVGKSLCHSGGLLEKQNRKGKH